MVIYDMMDLSGEKGVSDGDTTFTHHNTISGWDPINNISFKPSEFDFIRLIEVLPQGIDVMAAWNEHPTNLRSVHLFKGVFKGGAHR